MIKQQIRKLLKEGIYDANKIFNRLYPTFTGHYSRLRQEIAEVKNNG